ncbi:hypothetical protein ABLE93_14670 [Xanthobacter sp. KR7-65]|uniref:hypothetical protein n=1 Tax=Xanthobacter sp. KR7-65 TaxID=3156612 RepID=UPI0032B3E1CE
MPALESSEVLGGAAILEDASHQPLLVPHQPAAAKVLADDEARQMAREEIGAHVLSRRQQVIVDAASLSVAGMRFERVEGRRGS